MFYIIKRVTAGLVNVEADHDLNSVNLESEIQIYTWFMMVYM